MDRLNLLASLANAAHTDAVALEQWPAILADAERHHLLSLVWKNIKMQGAAALLPEKTRADAERRCVETALYTEHLLGVGNRLMRSARERGVTLVPLKGMSLVPKYYTAAERPMIDADFLVREAEIDKVVETMADAGFKLQPDRLSPEFLRRFGGEFKFSRSGGPPAVVETQWDIAAAPHLRRGYAFDSRWLLERVGGDGALKPEAALVYLVFHLGVAHSFSRLLWLLDVHRVITAGGVRWEEVEEAVGRFGMRRLFGCTLALCEEYFGTRVPEKFTSGRGGWAVGAARKCLSGGGWTLRSGVLPLLLGRNRLRAVGAYLFPGAEFVALRYGMPRWRASVYQFARPAALAAEAMKRKKDKEGQS